MNPWEQNWSNNLFYLCVVWYILSRSSNPTNWSVPPVFYMSIGYHSFIFYDWVFHYKTVSLTPVTAKYLIKTSRNLHRLRRNSRLLVPTIYFQSNLRSQRSQISQRFQESQRSHRSQGSKDQKFPKDLKYHQNFWRYLK